jgi:hypothetical protein
VEAGRVFAGVLDGVPLGVDVELMVPTRDFLEEERGVTLLLMNDLTGVAKSSRLTVASLGVVLASVRTLRPDWELLADAAEGASRGVKGVFAVRVVASVGIKGRPLFMLERSIGIVQRWFQGI